GEQFGHARSSPTRRWHPLRHRIVLAGVRIGCCTGSRFRDTRRRGRRTRHAYDRLDGFWGPSLLQRGTRARRWRGGVAVFRRCRGAERNSPPLARGWGHAGHLAADHSRSPHSSYFHLAFEVEDATSLQLGAIIDEPAEDLAAAPRCLVGAKLGLAQP